MVNNALLRELPNVVRLPWGTVAAENFIKKRKTIYEKKEKGVKVGGPIYVKRSSYMNHSLWYVEPFAHKISL